MKIGDIFFKRLSSDQNKTRYLRPLYRNVTFDRNIVLLAPKCPSYYSGKLFGRRKKAGSENRPPNNKPIHIGIRQGLFDDIYGFQDVKDLFEMAMHAEKPVHLLLCGPPASAKSLFMRALTKLERSYYAVGSSSTKSGIFDYLFEYRPRYFIIDELEKMNKKD
jgi:hypothetical protein